MALDNKYAWYIVGDTIAIVEVGTDDGVSNWSSISTSDKTFRIYASALATDFDSTLTDDNKTYNLDSRFRRALANYAIAIGYELPTNNNIKMAGYFLNKFRSDIIQMKKSRNQRKRDGSLVVHQHSF